jgi:uncharacterized protein YjbI with pentapeptide repeats
MREIKRLSGEVIAQGDGNIRMLAEENKTNLRYADLGGAYLEGADLEG